MEISADETRTGRITLLSDRVFIFWHAIRRRKLFVASKGVTSTRGELLARIRREREREKARIWQKTVEIN